MTLILAFVLSLGLAPAASVLGAEVPGDERPNFVLILTDDMDKASLAYTPRTRNLLGGGGTTFQNAFVTTSLCCPSRASILRGQYAHNHGVLSNVAPKGSLAKFRGNGAESSTIATWLDSSGYRTAYVGRYLNPAEEQTDIARVPPGWDEWYGVAGKSGYFGYRMNENGRIVSYGNEPKDYLTDVINRRATEEIRAASESPEPFFLHLSTLAPHSSYIPAPRHEGSYPNLKAPRTRSFNEKDVRDKPRWLQDRPRLSAARISKIDADYRDRARTLLAVDEMVEDVVEELKRSGELKNTYLVFTSDNGYHMGQHRLMPMKATAYEEDIRVPLLVRGPGVPAGRSETRTALNTDLAPTFADLAGAPVPGFVDGRSLRPLLSGAATSRWRTAFLVEYWNEPGDKEYREGRIPTYKAVRTQNHLYVEHGYGDRELYDLRKDPRQLRSIHDSAPERLVKRLEGRLAGLRYCSGGACRAAEDG